MKGILISKDLCIGCRACASACEHGIIQIEETKEFRKIIVSGSCPDECENCKDVCPTEAIKIGEGVVSSCQLFGAGTGSASTCSSRNENQLPAAIKLRERQEVLFRLTLCRRCGMPIAPEAMLNFISRRMTQPLFELDLCITCRQQLMWEAIRKR